MAIVLTLLCVATFGAAIYRHSRVSASEREYLARIERFADEHAATATVEAQIGAPNLKTKGPKCREEWSYRLRGDRVAVLCFDESGHAVSVSTGVSINRRDF